MKPFFTILSEPHFGQLNFSSLIQLSLHTLYTYPYIFGTTEHFSAALAKELGPRGITVNTVSPGVTDTDGLVLEPEQVNQLVAQTPLGRLGQPADVADAVALLVSDDAHWITGQSIRANGGIV